MCKKNTAEFCCTDLESCNFLLCADCNRSMDSIYKKQAEALAKAEAAREQLQPTPPKISPQLSPDMTPQLSPQEGTPTSELSDRSSDVDLDLDDSDPQVRFRARIKKAKANMRKQRKEREEKVAAKRIRPTSPERKRLVVKSQKVDDIDWGTAMKRIKQGEVGVYTEARFSIDDSNPENWDEPRNSVMWTYSVPNDTWTQEAMMVQVMLNPFSSGGMRDCFKMRSVTRIGKQPTSYAPMVAKVFKDASSISSEEYFNEAMTQMISEDFAKRFNEKTPDECNVTFVGVKVMRLERSSFSWKYHPRGSLFSIEPFLEGEYEKYSDNTGRIWESENSWLQTALPPAFSHFSLEESGLLLCVTDIQGVGRWYTDPQIHSYDGNGFGMGNLGQLGLKKFVGSHVCNDICLAVKLSPLGCTDPAFVRRMENNRKAWLRSLTSAMVDRSGKIVMKRWIHVEPPPVTDMVRLKDKKKKKRAGVLENIKKSFQK